MKKALVLRTCNADRTSRNGFVWPVSGPVECPDWDPRPRCGNGLHGALWGEGDGTLFDWSSDAVWQVIEVDAESVVNLGGKVKFPRGVVVHTGHQTSATSYIMEHGALGAVIGAAIVSGYRGTATAGYRGTATAGDIGTATAGDYGTATAGDYGTATAGDYGTATAGYRGTATAGDIGTATAGYRGTATAGYRGTLIIKHWDGARHRLIVGYVGENGIKANTPYRLNENGKFVEVEE